MPKLPLPVTTSAKSSGVVRLLQIQLTLLLGCIGVGVVLYDSSPALTAAALLLTTGVIVGICPAAAKWIAALLTGVLAMIAAVNFLPSVWLQGPAFVVMALASAAAGLLAVNRPGPGSRRF